MRFIVPVLCAVSVLGLTACSKVGLGSAHAKATSACQGDPYLMKYGCSVDKVQQAAEKGDADAEYALGYMYYYGVGTVHDPDNAKLWIQRAARQGQPLAKQALNMLLSPKSNTAAVLTRKQHKPVIKTAQANPVAPQANSTVGQANPASAPVAQSSLAKAAFTKKDLGPDQVVSAANTQPAPTSYSRESSDVAQMESRLLHLPKTGYTLQLMGNHNEKVIRNFVQSHHLENKAMYYYSSFNDSRWYMLIYGNYKTVEQAHEAIAKLPADLRKMQPWIKPYRDVQAEIKTRHLVS